LESAIHFMNAHTTPEATLAAALAFAGGENFCPVLVGAFCGARFGRSCVMLRAGHELRHLSRVLRGRMSVVARKLAETWQAEPQDEATKEDDDE
jgi:hypothetical protein